MLWVKVMYEDACTRYSYNLDTVTGYRSMWKKLQRVISFQEKGNPSFQKAYAGCITVWSHTYKRCIKNRARTYAWSNTTGHIPIVFLLIHVQFRYKLITRQLYRLDTGHWYKLIQLYNGISHSDSVTMVPSFYLYVRAVGLGNDRCCSHLPVVAGEHRGF